jgi:hypothetical protein
MHPDEYQPMINELQTQPKKVWMWGIRLKDKVWEHSKPELTTVKESVLRDVNYYENPVTELSIIHLRSIVFLFHSEKMALSFMRGYLLGRDAQGDDLWQDRLDKYIDGALSGNPVTDEDGMRGYKYDSGDK